MLLGPVFWMEMKTSARRARHYVTRALFVCAVFLVVWLTRLSYQPRAVIIGAAPSQIQELADLAEAIFAAYSITQFLLVLLLTPLYSAGAVAGDRERRVFELLLTTQLGNFEMVASKLLVRLIHLGMLVLAGLPVMFLCFLLGGVSSEQLLVTFALTLTMMFFVASLGLLISIGSRRALSAIFVTYGLLLIAWVALPFVAAILLGAGGPTGGAAAAIIALNPLIGLISAARPSMPGPPGISVSIHWWCVGVYGAAALVMGLTSVLLVRKLGLWASRERVVKERRKDRRRRIRRVWSNPVAWREVKTIAVHRRMRWARLLTLIFCVVLSSILWVGWLADRLSRRPALGQDREQLCFIIVATATLAWLLMVLQGSVSFSHEHEQSTLDALLTTPLSAGYIVLGKLAGIFRSSAFALAFPIGFSVLAWSVHVTSLRALVLTTVLILGTGAAAATLGLACSVRFCSSSKSAGLAATLVIAFCVGVPLLAELIVPWDKKYGLLPVTMVSPSVNVSWSIYEDESILASRYPGYGWGNDDRNWSERLGLGMAHQSALLALAAWLSVWTLRRIERTFRIRPGALPQPEACKNRHYAHNPALAPERKP